MKYLIKNARLSFPDLFEAKTVNGEGAPAYRAQLLVPEDGSEAVIHKDTGTDPTKAVWGPAASAKKGIEEAIKALAKSKWTTKADAILAANEGIPQKHCYIDGRKRAYDGYAGNWALSATRAENKGRPLVVDADRTPLIAADGKPYAGCYVNAVVQFWPQDNKHGKAVRCELISVQFMKDGDSFQNMSRGNEDEFDDVSAGATADDLA